MTIKQKLMFIAVAVAVTMLLSIVATRWTVVTLGSLTETQAVNHQLLSDVLILRRNEKDFIIRSDEKYLVEFNKNFSLLKDHIHELDALIESNSIVIERYDNLQKVMDEYESGFHGLVAISTQIGLTPKTGILGSLSKSARQAEAFFMMVKNDTLLKDQLILRRNEKDFIMRKDKKYIDKFNQNHDLFISDINKSTLGESPKSRLLKDILNYKKEFLNLTHLFEKRGLNSNLGIIGSMRNSSHQAESVLKEIHAGIEAGIIKKTEAIQLLNLVASLLIAFVIVSFTFFVSKSITMPLSGFVMTLKEICQSGNLSLKVDESGKDEISEVGAILNKMLSTFQEIIQKLHTTTQDLKQYSQQFVAIRESTFVSVDKQRIETEDVSSAMTEMAASAQNIAENTNRTAETSQQANTITSEGKRIVDGTVHSTQLLEDTINNANQVIQQLGEDSNSIGGILDVIRGIAEQTNLLALNAAIEAARAGEQGRGFAVVADEVRTLAQKTQDSISEIEQMISNLQSGSSQAIQAISKGQEGVVANVEQINNAGNSLSSIVAELNSINDMSQENASATRQQSTVVEEVQKNVIAIKDMGTLIVENIGELKEASDNMSILSHEMEDLVKNFQV